MFLVLRSTEYMCHAAVLRHIVSVNFRDDVSAETIDSIKKEFFSLMEKIPEIHSFEWGSNCSNEGLNKGFTHIFQLSFLSEKDRDTYVDHEKHVEFATMLKKHIQDIFVADYWAKAVHRA